MDRLILTDAQWAKMEPHCLGKPTDPGRTGSDNRVFVEAVLWIARTGSPWRDLLKEFGHWNTIFTRYRYWVKADVFKKRFLRRSQIIRIWNTPWWMAPSSRFTVTDKAQNGTESQAIGRSRSGLTTKILALADALGNLVRFVLLPGQRNDTVGVAPLIEGIEFNALIADKAFDSNWIIAELNARGSGIIVSQRPQRSVPLAIDNEIYKWRHLIENFFCKLKEFKTDRIAQRQNRQQLCRNDRPMLRRHQFAMNLNRP